MNELYNILSIFITSGLFLACVLFLFMVVPDNPLLGNYRKARYAMAGAYLFFVTVEIAKYLSGDLSEHSVPLLQTITLTIAAPQAFLFTFAILALLEVRFLGWRSIFGEAVPALGLIVIIFIIYAFCFEACFRAAFYGFAGIYALLLVRYTFLFIRNYRRFRLRMDNHYSSEEAGRLRWVAFSFFAALAIGVSALLSSIFMSSLVSLIFTVVFDIFVTFFAIRFINYAHRFHVIEAAIENDVPEEPCSAENKNLLSSPALNIIETRLKNWIEEKQFLQSSITLNDVSLYIGTNHKYLSVYINRNMNRTFREWINYLRIEEAKCLLTEYPNMSINEIASCTGFATKSHFGQQFRTLTKLSATV